MVSLETESDRTLFFDLLPIDVGSIGGFNTRIQLYTVPGQVFYNTTRKLVLKGVDGVVFVADSQKPMLKANLESVRNLEENLAEMGLALDAMPIVLQYNKRDLPDVSSVEELNRTLNARSWPFFEASASTGMGVFDTLKGVSKLTLVSLKKRLTKMDGPGRPIAAPRPVATIGASPSVSPAATVAIPRPALPGAPAAAAAPAAAKAAKPGKLDVLAELERLRKQTLARPEPAAETARPAPAPLRPALPGGAKPSASPSGSRPAATLNGKGEIHRSVELTLKKGDFRRARRFLLNLRVEDGEMQTVDAIRDLPIEISDPADLERVLLHLNVALRSKD
jgi:signal recognition particle receptor subunit beta